MTDIVFLYITHPDPALARALARALVERGLAACVNILPGTMSVYRWDNRIEEAEEAVMIVKTRAGLEAEARGAIVAAHPYDCPCVVTIPISGGHPDYLDWLTRGCRQG